MLLLLLSPPPPPPLLLLLLLLGIPFLNTINVLAIRGGHCPVAHNFAVRRRASGSTAWHVEASLALERRNQHCFR